MENSLHYTSVNHAYHLVDSINQLRKKEELCDVILNCGDTQIPAHKLILSVSTPYFKNLVDNQRKDTTKQELQVEGLDSQAVRNIIEFFYTSAVSVDDVTVWTLLPAACLLQVEEIQNLCCDFLSSQLQADNCLRINRVAAKCLCSGLLKESTEYIIKNFSQLLEEEEVFLDLSIRDLIGHLKRLGEMGLTNENILQVLKCWVICSVDDRQMLGYKLLQEFPDLKDELENFIPVEYQVQQDDGKAVTVDMKEEDSLFTNRMLNAVAENLVKDLKSERVPEKMETQFGEDNKEKTNNSTLDEISSLAGAIDDSEFESKSNPNKYIPLKEKDNFLLLSPEHIEPPDVSSPVGRGKRGKNEAHQLNYECSWPDCGKKFFSKTGLKFHVNKHKNVFPHNCTICGKGFNRSCEIEDHMNTHTGNFWKCSICGAVLKSQHGRRVHQSQHAKQQHECDVCGKLFPCKDYLNSHLRSHTNNFECQVCKKVFKRKHHYKEHVKVHEKNGFFCKFCDFRTNYAQSLKRHVKNSHDPEKLEVQTCKKCGKTFNRYDFLIKHVQNCTGRFQDDSFVDKIVNDVKAKLFSGNQHSPSETNSAIQSPSYLDGTDYTDEYRAETSQVDQSQVYLGDGIPSDAAEFSTQPEFPKFTYST